MAAAAAADCSSSSYGLDDLFTIKDYQPITIHIPRLRRDQDDEGDGDVLSIEVLQSPAACTDPDLTGQVIWPASRLLSHYLAGTALEHNNAVKGKTVLELGAGGTALPSLTAARLGAHTVIATDGNDGAVLDLLHQNINLHNSNNNHACSNQTQQTADADAAAAATAHVQPKQLGYNNNNSCQLTCRQLLWGNRSHVTALLQHLHHRPVDVVIAADVVQWPAVVEPLLHTVKSVLWRADDNDNVVTAVQAVAANDKPVFLLGIVQRASTVYNLFFSLARELGFVWRAIEPEEFLVNGIVPALCHEFGGRTTELYELTLRPDCGPPVLLQLRKQQQHEDHDDDDDDSDRIVGASFEQTTFLPC